MPAKREAIIFAMKVPRGKSFIFPLNESDNKERYAAPIAPPIATKIISEIPVILLPLCVLCSAVFWQDICQIQV